jgi:hypothetical protein
MKRPRVLRALKNEFLEILPVVAFFLAGLNLIAFSKHLVLEQDGIVYDGIAAASFGALVIAKVVLVANKLPVMRRYGGRPLYRPILYRTILYTLGVAAVRALEVLVRNAINEAGIAAGLAAARAELVWAHFAFVQIWVFVLFLVYVTAVELRDHFGPGSLTRALFDHRRARDEATE